MSERIVPATAALEAFHAEAMAALLAVCRKHEAIGTPVRTLEVIAVLARAAGTAVAACYPDERDLARKTAIANIDAAIAERAQSGPDRQGVHQA